MTTDDDEETDMLDQSGIPDEFNLLAEVSSQRTTHEPDCARDGLTRCQACRWFEVELAYSSVDGRYRITTTGRTLIPGEEDRVRSYETTSPAAVIDILAWDDDGRRFIAKTIRLGIHEAAERRPELGEALDDFDSIHAPVRR